MRRGRLYGFAALLVGYFAVYAHRVAMGYLGDAIAAQLGVRDTRWFRGYASSLYFYSYATAQIPTGFLLDTLGISVYGAAGVALMAIGGLLVAFPQSPLYVYLGRVLIGYGGASVFLSTQRYIARFHTPSVSVTLTSVVFIVGNMGAAYAQYPMVVLAEALGAGLSMATLVAISLASATMIPVLVDDRPGARGAASPRVVASQLSRILRDPHMLSLFAALFAGFGASFLLQALVLRDYIHDAYGMPLEQASLYTVYYALGYMAGNISVALLTERLGGGKKRVGVAVLAATAAATLFFLTQTAPPLLLAPLITLLGYLYGHHILLIPMGREAYPPEYSGTATSFVNMGCFIGAAVYQTLAPLLLPGTTTTWNYTGIAYMLTTTLAATTLLVALFVRSR